MNRHLPQHFTERQILDIFAQICAGVAKMHYHNPPIAHRDLKVRLVPPTLTHIACS